MVRGLVGVQAVQDIGGLVNGVLPHPCPGRMRRDPVRDHVEPHGAVAAALDAAVGRLADDREIAGEPIGMRLGHLPQTVLLRPQPPHGRRTRTSGHIAGRPAWRRGTGTPPRRTPSCRSRRGPTSPARRGAPRRRPPGSAGRRAPASAAGSCRSPEPCQGARRAPRAPRPAERRGRDHRVAVPVHRQVRLRPQERLHGVGQRLLVIADGNTSRRSVRAARRAPSRACRSCRRRSARSPSAGQHRLAAIVVVVVMLTILTAARPVGARCRARDENRPELPVVCGENKRATRSMPCYRGSRDGFSPCVMRQNLAKHMRMAVWGLPANGKGMGICRGLLNAMEGFCVIGIVIGVGYVAARMRIGGPSAQTVLNRFSFFVSSPCLMFAILFRKSRSSRSSIRRSSWRSSPLYSSARCSWC